MRRSSSVCCRSTCLVLLVSVMSRATFEMPMVAPEGDLIGEMLSETSIRLAILSQPHRFVVLDAFAPADPAQRVLHLRQPVVGHEQRDVLARGFRRAVSEQPLRRRVPAGDGAVERRRDDGVVGGFDRRAEQPLPLGMMVARRYGAAMLLDLLLERERSLHSLPRSLAQTRARARRSRRLHRPEWRPCPCWPPPERLRSAGRSAGSATARSAAPARPRTTPRSLRPEARCS